jgi:carboxymethylenebutenolidase
MKQGLFLFWTIFLLFACNRGPAVKNEQTLLSSAATQDSFMKQHETPAPFQYASHGKMITIPVPGGTAANVYAVEAEQPSNKYVLVFHEWWGLNDYIKKQCDKFYTGVAGSANIYGVDLYDGKVATSQDEASHYMRNVTDERAKAIINAVLEKAGPNASISTVGWCFGGGWSLRTAIMAGNKGNTCVMFYGEPVKNAKEIEPLHAKLVGIWANQDAWITPALVDKFESLLKATGKDYLFRRYTADHAFANPSSPRFDKEMAQNAMDTVMMVMRERVWGGQ